MQQNKSIRKKRLQKDEMIIKDMIQDVNKAIFAVSEENLTYPMYAYYKGKLRVKKSKDSKWKIYDS